MNPELRPPHLAESLLKRLVPRGIAGESILGDLRESFDTTSRSRGRVVACAHYWIDVLRIAVHRPRHRRRVERIRRTGAKVRRLGSLLPDAQLAVRMLVKSPLLSLIGGLGITVATAVATLFFTFLTFFYSAPPVEDGDRVVTVEYVDEHGRRSTLVDFRLWKDEVESIQDLAAYRTVDRDIGSSIQGAAPDEVAEMTASGFRVARVPPLLGRPLLDSDERDGVPPVVVIGYREWQERFGGDPAVVGREVRVSGIPHTVVGVMPDGFRLPVNHGFWTALMTGSREGRAAGAEVHVFGRLAPGIDPAAAEAEVAAIGQRMLAEAPGVPQRLRAVVAPYIRHIWASVGEGWLLSLFGWLFHTVVAVNVAVLFYARTALRRAEITVRTALGASRGRIVTQLFVEALALSLAATAIGLLIAHVGFQQLTMVEDFQDELPHWLRGGLPPEAIVYAAGLAAFTALVVGVIPALQATGQRLQSTLREVGGGTGLRLGRTWTALICLQVAVAVGVLPAVVGIAWYYTPPPTPTFAVSELLSIWLRPPSPLPGTADSGQQAADAAHGSLQAELLRRIEAIPEVANVTFTSFSSGVRIEVEGQADGAIDGSSSGSLRVDVGYFGVFGVPLLAGRRFTEDDAVEGTTAAIVNRAFVDEYFADGSALGRRFREVPLAASATYARSGQSFIVVGVVENMFRPSRPNVYHPMALGTEPRRLFARTSGMGAATIAPRVREVAAEIAPAADPDVDPLNSLYDLDVVALRLVLLTVGLATLSVLLLSAGGISAMMSFAVTQRRREVGIRTALGASHRQVMASIFSQSIRQLGTGLLFGVAAAAVLNRLTGREYLGDEATSLLAIVVAVVFVSGLLATLGPARRALRIEPNEAMRAQ